jgi:hypothetical protein
MMITLRHDASVIHDGEPVAQGVRFVEEQHIRAVDHAADPERDTAHRFHRGPPAPGFDREAFSQRADFNGRGHLIPSRFIVGSSTPQPRC